MSYRHEKLHFYIRRLALLLHQEDPGVRVVGHFPKALVNFPLHTLRMCLPEYKQIVS